MIFAKPPAPLPDRPLWRDISLVLLVKAAALAGIWYLFFSEPVDKQLGPDTVSEHILD